MLCSLRPPSEIILLSNQEALNIRLSHWRDFTQEFVDKSVTLVAGAGPGRGSCDVSCRCLDYDQNILNFNSNNHFDSSWIISHFLPDLAMARSCSRPVIGKWRKTWPRSRAFMFNFHYWHRVSCEDNNFHNQGPELSGGHGKTEAHYYYYPHKKSHGWTKIRRDKNPSEYLIQWNV